MIDKVLSFRRLTGLFIFLFAVFAGLATPILVSAAWAQESVVQFDPAQTKIQFALDDVLHTVHGTFALKNGTIRFDPSSGKISGAITVDATSGASGNSSRDKRMHREILESGKFPEFTFTPKQMTGAIAAGSLSKVEVSGQFRVHGQDHEVTLTVDVDVKPDGRQLQITTHCLIPYVQWGLKNPSTFLLRVSDKVAIDIHATGLVQNAEASR